MFLGVSAPGLLNRDDITRMKRAPIIFAMTNPKPEIMPEETEGLGAVMATGRSDYPQICPPDTEVDQPGLRMEEDGQGWMGSGPGNGLCHLAPATIAARRCWRSSPNRQRLLQTKIDQRSRGD